MTEAGRGYGAGKVILLGEHAVVYGQPALAVGLPDGMEVRLFLATAGIGRVRCSQWALDLGLDHSGPLPTALRRVLEAAGAPGLAWDIEIIARLPASAGLGSSAALCVAAARAAGQAVGKPLDDSAAAAAAFEGERCFHGTPSGVDNTVAAFGGLIWFQRPDMRRKLPVRVPLELCIAHSGRSGETAALVAGVRAGREGDPVRFDATFARIGRLVGMAAEALSTGRLEDLGRVMDQNHAALQELGVSSEKLDEIVVAARAAGALGAKLTGAGGGGCAIALCRGNGPEVAEALERRGFRTLLRTIPVQD
jgi:mevalonate kinase